MNEPMWHVVVAFICNKFAHGCYTLFLKVRNWCFRHYSSHHSTSWKRFSFFFLLLMKL